MKTATTTTTFAPVKSVKGALKDIRVNDIFTEVGNIESGKVDWWIYLDSDYICVGMECSTIHERTLAECLWLLNNDVVHISEFNKLKNL
jgi:hypothetical protein